MKYTVTVNDAACKTREISLGEAKTELDKLEERVNRGYPKEEHRNLYADLCVNKHLHLEGVATYELNRIPETYAEQMKESGEYLLDAEYWNEPY